MNTGFESIGIISGFMASVEKYPELTALDVNDQIFSYKQLRQKSLRITSVLQESGVSSKFVSLLAYRSVTAYAGIIGVLASGKGYVPLNPYFPIERIVSLMKLSGSDSLVVGEECFHMIGELLELIEIPLTIIIDGSSEQVKDLGDFESKHAFYYLDSNSDAEINIELPKISGESIAYLLFTSGSTGIPKGVAVSHNNVKSFVEYICNRCDFNEKDRFSQTADINFDLSVLEIFPCWQQGSCLCCLPKETVMAPARYIRDKHITVWVSVPSIGIFMTKMRLLKPNTFPLLRYCMFCGEALLGNIAEKWMNSAPNSTILNLYGPTEATVAITEYKWSEGSLSICKNGIVPIGWTFDGQNSCIIDQDFKVVKRGKVGELCLSGSQVTKGYFNNEEKTASQYIKIPSIDDQLWYKTGDLVSQDEDGCMHYIGRVDSQIQVLGYRVELQEIDCLLRKSAGTELAITIAWPVVDGSTQGIVGFVDASTATNKDELINYCKKSLPTYMIPRDVYFVENMPTNANGKIDRLKLTKMLEEGVLS